MNNEDNSNSEDNHDHTPPHPESHTKIDIENSQDKKNPWKGAAILFGILTIILVVLQVNGGGEVTGNVISGEEAGQQIVDYLNKVTPGGIEFISSDDIGNLYEVTVSFEGQNIPIFVTKDGKYFAQAVAPLDDTLLPDDTGFVDDSIEPIEVSADDDSVKGDINSPVEIIEFSDYQCPFCSRFYTDTLPQLEEEYIKTGKVKLIYRDFPLNSIHPQAQQAAEAAECAGEQNKYYEYHNILFENQHALDTVSLKQYALDLKLKTKEFNDCLDSQAMKEEVEKDLEDGISYGVTGTPAFFVNGKLLSGAQPFEAFKKIIDEELQGGN
jgi:protein-disulfide isomerase